MVDNVTKLLVVDQLTLVCCHTGGNLSPTVRALIGYFEVTCHLTMKLFPAKNSELATSQKSMTSEGNNALLPANLDRRPPLQRV